MFVRVLNKAEREKYFAAYMEKQGYKPDLWLQSDMTYELWNEGKYSIVKVYKHVHGKRSLIDDRYHANH